VRLGEAGSHGQCCPDCGRSAYPTFVAGALETATFFVTVIFASSSRSLHGLGIAASSPYIYYPIDNAPVPMLILGLRCQRPDRCASGKVNSVSFFAGGIVEARVDSGFAIQNSVLTSRKPKADSYGQNRKSAVAAEGEREKWETNPIDLKYFVSAT